MNDAQAPGSMRLGPSSLASNPILRYPVWLSDSEAIRETGSTPILERLDEVPWDTLEHAYGPADDIPDLLRRC